jgi:MFS family permease
LLVMACMQLGVAVPLHALVLRRRPEDLGFQVDGQRLSRQRALADVPSAGATRVAGDLAHPPEHPSQPPRSPPEGTLRTALVSASFWTLTGAYACAGLATNVLLVHAVPYLLSRGYGGALAATIAGAVGLTSLPGRYGLNRLSDRARVGPQRLLGLCLVLQAGGILLLLAGGVWGVGWLGAYVVVYGAAYGAASPLRAGVMADHFGRRAYGAITAVQGVPVALAAGIGPLIAGWLFDRQGNYNLALLMCAGAFLLAAIGVSLTQAAIDL